MSGIAVLALAASPRKGGNSDIMLDKVIAGISSVKAVNLTKIYLNDLKLVPCQSCGGCEKSGKCIIKDDMTIIYEHLMKLSILAVASPMYFNNVSAQLKAVIDRCQCHWIDNFVLGKLKAETSWPRKGIFVSTRGQRGMEMFKYPLKTIKAFFNNENIEYFGDVFVDGVDKKGDIQKYPEKLKEAYVLGQNAVQSLGGE